MENKSFEIVYYRNISQKFDILIPRSLRSFQLDRFTELVIGQAEYYGYNSKYEEIEVSVNDENHCGDEQHLRE